MSAAGMVSFVVPPPVLKAEHTTDAVAVESESRGLDIVTVPSGAESVEEPVVVEPRLAVLGNVLMLAPA
jgi:hypothetical protein